MRVSPGTWFALARAAGASAEAVAIRELDAATRRVDNASLAATLPHLGLSTDAIVGAIDVDRR